MEENHEAYSSIDSDTRGVFESIEHKDTREMQGDGSDGGEILYYQIGEGVLFNISIS